jgi:transposase
MGKARTRWAVEEKRRIVELTLEPGASVARVAQAEGVNANQVFQWRRAYRDGELPAGGASTALLPVVIGAEAGSMAETASAPEVPQATPDEACPVQPSGAIHIELPGRAAISVERGADRALLRTILESLQRRSNCAPGRGSGWRPARRTCGAAFTG